MSIKYLKVLISVLVVGTMVTTVSIAANGIGIFDNTPAAGLKPPQFGSSDPILEVSDLPPGGQSSGEFSISNPNIGGADLFLGGALQSGDARLYDVLEVTVDDRDSNQQLFSGTLRNLDQDFAAGQLAAGAVKNMRLTLSLPSWIANEFQANQVAFKARATFIADPKSFDKIKPSAWIKTKVKRRSRKVWLKKRRAAKYRYLTIAGGSKDNETGVSRVEASLIRVYRKNRANGRSKNVCKSWVPLTNRFTKLAKGRCKRHWFTVTGSPDWSFKVPTFRLARGKYRLLVRAVDEAGNSQSEFVENTEKPSLMQFRVIK